MKKILFILFCSVASIGASAQTGKVSVNAGFLFPSTLNATLVMSIRFHTEMRSKYMVRSGITGRNRYVTISGKDISGMAVWFTSTVWHGTRTA